VVISALIFFPTIHSLGSNVRPEGSRETLQDLVLIFQALAAASFFGSLATVCEYRPLLMTMLCFFSFAVFILAAYGLSYSSIFESVFQLAFESILSSPNSLVLFFILIATLIVIQGIIYQTFIKRLYYPAFETVRNAVLRKDHSYLRSLKDPSQYLKLMNSGETVTSICKQCFDADSGTIGSL
jgi:hypothetical protein